MRFGHHLSSFCFLNIHNQSAVGNVIQPNEKKSPTMGVNGSGGTWSDQNFNWACSKISMLVGTAFLFSKNILLLA